MDKVTYVTEEKKQVCLMLKTALNDEATAGPMYQTIIENMPAEHKEHLETLNEIKSQEGWHFDKIKKMAEEMGCE